MEIILSEIRTVSPDTFQTFPGGGNYQYGGPATFVWIVSTYLAADQTLRVRVYNTSNLASGASQIEDVTITPAESNRTGFQSVPVPAPSDQWGTMLGLDIVGGTADQDVTVVTIAL